MLGRSVSQSCRSYTLQAWSNAIRLGYLFGFKTMAASLLSFLMNLFVGGAIIRVEVFDIGILPTNEIVPGPKHGFIGSKVVA
jgi:hypothetical protein